MLPVIFMSDFGGNDPYVGQVKGVMQRYAPGHICIDLYHDLPPFAWQTGAWLLHRCRPYMPERGVWLAIVDPGVGSRRRALAIQVGDSFFLGPDNGILTPVLDNADQIVALDSDLKIGHLHTFHGRDLFAPAAAWLLRGAPLTELGTPITDPVQIPYQGWLPLEWGWMAEVMLVDRFGNLITGLPGEVLSGKPIEGRLDGSPCLPLVRTFSDVPVNGSALVIGSFGTVEVVVNQGSAAERFSRGRGDLLKIS